jgi:rod shape determining protein RodA
MESSVRGNIDYVIIVTILLLVAIGALSVYSATYEVGAAKYFDRQLVWIFVGLILMIIIMFIPFRTLQLISYPLYGASLLALVGVLVAGKTVAGSTSWYGVKGLGMQPSEFVKVTTVLAIASFLSRGSVNIHRLKDIMRMSAFAIVPVVLILLEPDLGTAVIYFGMLFLIMYWAGASNFQVIVVMAPALAAIAALYGTTPFVLVLFVTMVILLMMRENYLVASIAFSLTVLVGVSVQFMFLKLAPHQQKRILIFMNPDADPLGAGYNVMQSKIAIGSGGLLGKGFLQGTQTQLNFLPAQWTDFIFCVPSEEFGFVGALLILVLLAILLLRGVHIAKIVKSRYASIVAIGVVSAFVVHVGINVGMAMGIVPVIGVPLPFISYGGSSMLSNLMMGGLLLNMYANRKEY